MSSRRQNYRTQLSVERFERRDNPGTFAYADLNAGDPSSDPERFVYESGSRVTYFVATTAGKGQELGRITAGGATDIFDLTPGANNSTIVSMAANPNQMKLLFTAMTGGMPGTPGLWKSLFGNTPTQMATFVSIGEIARIGQNGWMFAANGDDGKGNELWWSDGTVFGPHADIYGGSDSSNPFFFCTSPDGNTLLFEAKTANGDRLFKVTVVNPAPGEAYSKPQEIGNMSAITLPPVTLRQWAFVGTRFYFAGDTDGANLELWTVDLAGGGGLQSLRKFSGMQLRDFRAFNGKLLFAAAVTGGLPELWMSDGTVAGTSAVISQIIPTDVRDLVVAGNTLFFSGSVPGFGQELCTYNGTSITRVTDRVPLAGSFQPQHLVAMGNKVYFSAVNVNTGFFELWDSDGTDAGTILLSGGIGTVNLQPTNLIVAGNKILFSGVHSTNGRELWQYTPGPDY